MKDIKISDMMKMQLALWENNKHKWSPMEPEYGRNSLLWMIEEVGEVISIIKKKSETEIMENPEIRSKFVEEIADVYMYLTDTLLRYGVTAEEIGTAYVEKHVKNIGRNYSVEYEVFLKEIE
jgi:NTP pyrophosphatase (non-canonical NTP hydrolase)